MLEFQLIERDINFFGKDFSDMPYRKKTRKKLSKSILSGLFAGAGSVGAFALGMVVVGSVSDNFGSDQSQDFGFTQQSGKQQADAGASQPDDAPPGDNSDEGQGSIDGGPGLGDGPSDGEGDSEGGDSSLPGNDQAASGDGQPGNQGNNGGNPSEDGSSVGGTGGFGGGGSGGSGGGASGGDETLADNESGGDTPTDAANPPEEEIVAGNTNPDGTEDTGGPSEADGNPSNNGPSSDGPPVEDISEIEDVGDYYPIETLTVDDEGAEDETSGGKRVMAEVMSVPEPGAASILALGLLGALGLARSRKKRI